MSEPSDRGPRASIEDATEQTRRVSERLLTTTAPDRAERAERPPSSPSGSLPPSEPRPSSRMSFEALDAQVDRPARLQMIVALILGLVLVAIPLYLWRRPRAESLAAARGSEAPSAAPAAVLDAPPSAVREEKLAIGEAKVLSCHDPGPKKTAPEQCDHVVDVEKALAKAIEETASCVPKDAGGGAIQYVAEVSFKKKAIGVSIPKEGRTMKNAKLAMGCQSAVKNKLQATNLDNVAHQHTRYRIAITATYPGAIK